MRRRAMGVVMGGGVARAGAMLAVVFLVSGCTASKFAAPVDGFAKATKAAQTNLDRQLDAVDTAIIETALQDAVNGGGVRVVEADGDCSPESERCRLFVSGSSGDWPFSRGALGRNVRDLMAGLANYADGLNKIATADTATQIQKATADAKASIIGLAGTVSKIPGADPSIGTTVTALAGPITELVSFGLRRFTERIKLRALREAVDLMEPVLDAMVFVFDEASNASTDVALNALQIRFLEAKEAWIDRPRDRAVLVAYRSAAEEYDAALRGRPRAMFQALRSAHTALSDALHGRGMTFESIWPYLQTVFEEAEKFANIVKQLQDAGAKL